jgi:hypothetical protein
VAARDDDVENVGRLRRTVVLAGILEIFVVLPDRRWEDLHRVRCVPLSEPRFEIDGNRSKLTDCLLAQAGDGFGRHVDVSLQERGCGSGPGVVGSSRVSALEEGPSTISKKMSVVPLPPGSGKHDPCAHESTRQTINPNLRDQQSDSSRRSRNTAGVHVEDGRGMVGGYDGWLGHTCPTDLPIESLVQNQARISILGGTSDPSLGLGPFRDPPSDCSQQQVSF